MQINSEYIFRIGQKYAQKKNLKYVVFRKYGNKLKQKIEK